MEHADKKINAHHNRPTDQPFFQKKGENHEGEGKGLFGERPFFVGDQHSQAATGSEDFKTKLGAGGIAGLVLDATFNVENTPCKTLQIVQVFWGTPENAIAGMAIGKNKFSKGKKKYDSFVDGGINSPYVTSTGNAPAHATEPYYLTGAEHASQVVFNKDAGSIRVYDRPSAVVHFDEAIFETAVVAVDYKGKGKDKVLKVFRWGWKNKGADAIHGKGIKLNGAPTGISMKGGFSGTAKQIISNDYPNYTFT